MTLQKEMLMEVRPAPIYMEVKIHSQRCPKKTLTSSFEYTFDTFQLSSQHLNIYVVKTNDWTILLMVQKSIPNHLACMKHEKNPVNNTTFYHFNW